MKKIACSLMLAWATLPAWADASDAARIASLEARVAELEKRLLVLEQKSSQNIVIEHRRGSKPVFVCQASAFGKNYEAAEGNEGLARIKVRKACLADHDEMFCRDSRMKCQRFD